MANRRWIRMYVEYFAAWAIVLSFATPSHQAAAAPVPVSASAAPAPAETLADRIVVEKSLHRMTLWHREALLRTYAVALGQGGLAPKQRQGDARVPEGRFRIVGRNAHSAYHLALRIDYPRPSDVAAARARGDAPGGDVMIHGLPNGQGELGARHRLVDWTLGCVAVTNEEIEEVWRLVPIGTVVEIRP
jgi:murein L,D-transpeptidase YafK